MERGCQRNDRTLADGVQVGLKDAETTQKIIIAFVRGGSAVALSLCCRCRQRLMPLCVVLLQGAAPDKGRSSRRRDWHFAGNPSPLPPY